MKYILKSILLIVALLSASTGFAQVYINGHRVVADASRAIWLCTTAEENFQTDFRACVTFTDSIASLTINDIQVNSGDTINVEGLGASTSLPVVALLATGEQRIAALQFTFLPIVEFYGTFNKTTFVTVPFSVVRPNADDIEALAKVRYRGSLTNQAAYEKRGYKVKFVDANDEKLDLQLFPGLRKDNCWVLEGGAADLLRVRNYISAQLWNDMVTPPYYFADDPRALSATRGQLVEMFGNGGYVGLYNMCEPIDRKQMKLVKYDENTLEIHGQLWKADDRSRITLMDTMPPYMPGGNIVRFNYFETKYPDFDEVKPTNYAALYNLGVLSAYADDSTFAAQIAERVDIPVIIDYYIFCEALFAFDNEGKNVYWACYDRTVNEKLTPAIWDVDVSFGQDWKVTDMHGSRVNPWNDFMDNIYNHHRFLKRLFKLDVDNFRQRVNERYAQLRTAELSDEALCNRFVEVVDLLKRSGTAAREEWRHCPDNVLKVNIDFDSELEYILDWIPRRMQYLDDYVFVEHRIKRGDMNDDGMYDVEDLNQVINMVLGGCPITPIGDTNYDSKIDISDVNVVINKILDVSM